MNAETVAEWLAAIGVPDAVLSVGAEADNAWCLVRDPEPGPDGVLGWEVYWREQGNRYDWARFTDEAVACHYLFGRLALAQVTRGVVGVLPAPAEQPARSGSPGEDAQRGIVQEPVG